MKTKHKKSPFFSKFLESQQVTNKTEIAGGSGPTSILKDQAQTLKYPSDAEDVVTTKFPSDNDEAITLKYPSDGDDVIPTLDS
jgi:Serine endopeptidase inhibitors